MFSRYIIVILAVITILVSISITALYNFYVDYNNTQEIYKFISETIKFNVDN